MKLSADETRTLLDRLAEAMRVQAYDPKTMVSAPDLAARLHISKGTARQRLRALVDRGILQEVKVGLPPHGRPGWAYTEKTVRR